MIVQLTIAVWLALEAGLLIRDRIRGKGSAARDRGTLWLNVVIITAAVVAVHGLRRPHEAARAGNVVIGRRMPARAGTQDEREHVGDA